MLEVTFHAVLHTVECVRHSLQLIIHNTDVVEKQPDAFL